MKRIIGWTILFVAFAFLIVGSCTAYSWDVGLITWAAGTTVALILLLAVLLITGVL